MAARRYAFYSTSEAAIAAMHKAVAEAKHSIYWETFIFRNDTFPAYDFFSLFKQKTMAGVKVRIIVDGFGGFWYTFGKELEAELRAAGVEILFFNHWFRRIHRKILIVDERVAFIGGVNVAQEYRRWLDLHIMLRERHMMQPLIRSFARSYRLCGGKDPELLSMPVHKHLRQSKLWLLEHWPWIDKLLLRKHYRGAIERAQKEITIVTPYFYPSRWLITLLEQAMRRGVRVDVILPKKTESSFSTFSNHVYVKLLEKSGIHFYWSKAMLHAKALLIDESEGLVGSNNIDQLSFDWNAEAGVLFTRKDMIHDLKKIVGRWKQNAEPYDSHKEEWRWYHKPFAAIVRLLSPVI